MKLAALQKTESVDLTPTKMINNLPAIALSKDLELRNILAEFFMSKGWSGDGVVDAGPVETVELLAQSTTPPILIIDVDRLSDPVSYLEQLSAVCDAGCEVIVIGFDNRIQTYHEIKSLGILDYIPKPVTTEALEYSLSLMDKPSSGKQEDQKIGTTVAVIGARGGAGATSLAMEIATMSMPEDFLKTSKKNKSSKAVRHTALLDLDMNFGCTALYADVQPGHALVESIVSPERIDDLFLERSVISLPNGVQLLAAEDDPGQVIEPDEDAIPILFNKLALGYANLILDVPRHMVPYLG